MASVYPVSFLQVLCRLNIRGGGRGSLSENLVCSLSSQSYILHCEFWIFFIFLGVLLDEVGKWCIMVLRKT